MYSLFSFLIVIALFCVGGLSLTYYAIFFAGPGSITGGNWKFLLVPDFIVCVLCSLIMMTFLYQFILATYVDGFASRRFGAILLFTFLVFVVCIAGGAVAGLYFTVQQMEVVLSARVTFASFTLVISVLLLCYNSWLFYGVKTKKFNVSQDAVLMMRTMVIVASILVGCFSLQLGFEVMRMETQAIRPALWADAIFSKLLPIAVISFALLFVIAMGIFMGKRDGGRKDLSLRKPILGTEEDVTNVPMAYQI